MQLRLYWVIVKKRSWIIVGLLVAFALSYLLAGPRASSGYSTSMRFVLGIKPEAQSAGFYTFDRYYTWLTAEYLIDDLAEITKSQVFAQDVATVAGLEIPAGAIQGATSAGKLHRVLSVYVTWHDANELARIADAVVEVLTDRGDAYFAQLGTDSAVISLIDPPAIAPIGASLRQRLDLPLRLVLALGAGVFLVFLLDYLDDSVRDRHDVRELGLLVVGEIPTRRRRLGRFWERRLLP